MKKTLISILTLALTSVTYSATVPEGTELADKQIVRINNHAELQSLDPHKFNGIPEGNVARQMLEGLTTTGEKGELQPLIATEWSSSDDFKTWTFKLRKDSVWSNGDPVTANDFVYAWRRLVTPETASPSSSFLDYAHMLNHQAIIKGEKKPEELGVKAIDDHTLEITLTEPVPYFPMMTAHPSLLPLHKATVEKHGGDWTKPENWVGNGAYKLKTHILNEKLVIERNDKYRDNDKTVIEEAIFYPIDSNKIAFNRYKAGEIEFGYGSVPLELFDKVQAEMGDELVISPSLCSYYYLFNQEKVTNPKLREALKLAIDRDVITKKITKAGETSSYTFTPKITDGGNFSDPDWAKLSQKERVEKAKELLKESGYDTSKPLEILYNTSESHKKIAIAIGSMWKQNLGLKTTLRNQEWKTYLDTRQKGTFEISRAGWCASFNEPSQFLNIFKGDSSDNHGRYKNADYDKGLVDALRAKTGEDRSKVYQKLEGILDAESAIIPIYYYVNVDLIKPNLKGISAADPLQNYLIKDMYLTK